MPPKKRSLDAGSSTSTNNSHNPIPNRGRPPKRASMGAVAVGSGEKTTFVMKLFDRSLDLAKFSAASGLYPICRAWMENQPRAALPSSPNGSSAASRRRQPLTSLAADLRAGTVTKITAMPAVKPCTSAHRIPTQLPRDEDDDDELSHVRIADFDLAYDPDEPPHTRAELLGQLKRRSVRVRRHWHEQTQEYQTQTHGQSLLVLESLCRQFKS